MNAQNLSKVDLSGKWYWEGRPFNEDNTFKNGRMYIELNQKKNKLQGRLLQLNGNKLNYQETFYNWPDKEQVITFDSELTGWIHKDLTEKGNRIVVLKRLVTKVNNKGYIALFTGNLSSDSQTIEGYFVNSWGEGGRGWFIMKKDTSDLPEDFVASENTLNNSEIDRRAILNLVQKYEKAISERDIEALLNIYDSEQVPVASSKIDRDITISDVNTFGNTVLGIKGSSETFDQIIINVRGNFATMHAHYNWLINSVNKGGGEMIWLLAKTPEGWKVIHHTWQEINTR